MTRIRIHLTPAEAATKGLLCQKHLKAIRLMPGPETRPAGTVWQGQGAYAVYDPTDCIPYRWEPGPAQLRRQWVAAQAQTLISGNCLLLDTETTGVRGDDEVCEIAIIDATGATILDTLIRPTKPIPSEATAIHKITDAMVATAPSWPEVAAEYAAIVKGRTVVAYNCVFDKRLLMQTHSIHGLTAPVTSMVCAMLLDAAWNSVWDKHRNDWLWRKLVDAAVEAGASEDGAHRAHADARMTLGLLRFFQGRTSGRRPPLPKRL